MYLLHHAGQTQQLNKGVYILSLSPRNPGNSTVLPGLRLRVSPPVTHSANILYAGLVAVNFFACLW